MRALNENMIEWIFILFTTLLLPCFLTLLIAGTEAKENEKQSGILLEYESGEKVDMEDFLPYMIAGEIDLNYEEETLKAQAVIARTNLMRELNGKKKKKIKNLSLTYLTPEKFESSMGEKVREKIWYKLKKAVKSTYGQTLTYEDNYIEALYHAVSIGMTVSAEEIFGKARPYLISVPSSQDVESEDYMSVTEWTKEEILHLLNGQNKALNATTENIISFLQVTEKTTNGYVKEIRIGEEKMTGDEWKELFGLNSTNFYLEEYNGKLRMITLGKGHGIGMSQYGANCMALEKADYRTILKKYYPGTTLKENFAK